MGNQLKATTWRVPCNQANPQNAYSLLTGTGQMLTCWKASTLIVQGALFTGDPTQSGNLVTDLSNIASVVLAMRIGGPAGALLFNEMVIPAANLHPGLLYANWTGGTDQHFVFTVTTDMLNVAAQQKVWLVIGVNTADGSAFPVAANAAVQINDPGINNPTDANSTSVYTGWSKAEADARYAPLAAGSSFAPSITSVGDGAGTSLEAVATVPLAAGIPVLKTFRAAGYLQHWVLDVGTGSDASVNDEAGPRVKLPNDYNPAAPLVWSRWPSL